ncbi:uncharacterized protein LOC143100898 isoform X2 [Alosa pseudoharengus]|uniref:uncharacterized protein LOC143100898 isoform X2 n=1 Tax=Alosa pseudoharengus TaxID=34774 RepID=UPI003F8AE126
MPTNKQKCHRSCQCGWSNVTTYQGLRTHQGKAKCGGYGEARAFTPSTFLTTTSQTWTAHNFLTAPSVVRKQRVEPASLRHLQQTYGILGISLQDEPQQGTLSSDWTRRDRGQWPMGKETSATTAQPLRSVLELRREIYSEERPQGPDPTAALKAQTSDELEILKKENEHFRTRCTELAEAYQQKYIQLEEAYQQKAIEMEKAYQQKAIGLEESYKQKYTELEEKYQQKQEDSRITEQKIEKQQQDYKELRARMASSIADEIQQNLKLLNDPCRQSELVSKYEELRLKRLPRIISSQQFQSDEARKRIASLVKNTFEKASKDMEAKTDGLYGIFSDDGAEDNKDTMISNYIKEAIRNLQMALLCKDNSYYKEIITILIREEPAMLTPFIAQWYKISCLMCLHNPPLVPSWDTRGTAADPDMKIFPPVGVMSSEKTKDNNV